MTRPNLPTVRIAPSILNADFARLEEQIRLIEQGGADWLHLDIMDGHFVPNLTFGPPVIEKLRAITDLPFDAHLMIENPDRYLADFAHAGADILTVHIETGYHLHRTIEAIHSLDKKAGISLNPATPASFLEPLLPFVDLVLVMTVNPGFGGQTFIAPMLKKIREIADLIHNSGRQIFLEVDGGVNEETIQDVVSNGADTLVIGSAIFGKQDIPSAVARFRSLAAGALGKA